MSGNDRGVEIGGEFTIVVGNFLQDAAVPQRMQVAGSVDGRIKALAVATQVRVGGGVKRLMDIADEVHDEAERVEIGPFFHLGTTGELSSEKTDAGRSAIIVLTSLSE